MKKCLLQDRPAFRARSGFTVRKTACCRFWRRAVCAVHRVYYITARILQTSGRRLRFWKASAAKRAGRNTLHRPYGGWTGIASSRGWLAKCARQFYSWGLCWHAFARQAQRARAAARWETARLICMSKRYPNSACAFASRKDACAPWHKRLDGDIRLPLPSVGATENLLLACTRWESGP